MERVVKFSRWHKLFMHKKMVKHTFKVCLTISINIKCDIAKTVFQVISQKKLAVFQDEWWKKNFDTFKNTWPDLAKQRRCKKWYWKIYGKNLQRRRHLFRTGILYFTYFVFWCCIYLELLELRIHSRSTNNFLNSLSVVICDDMNSSLAVWRDSI